MSPEDEESLAELLLTLERQLMDPDFRRDRERVSALLAKEFREIGSSGRVWSREAILDLLAAEPEQPAPAVEDFAIQQLAPDVVLASYRTRRGEAAALRSSIWVGRGEGWQMLFHQGTKVPNR